MNKKISTMFCCIVMLVFGLTLSVTSTLLPIIAKDFKLTLSQSGLLFSFNFLGFFIFIILSGILAEKYSKKLILCISLFTSFLSLLFFGISKNLVLSFISIFFLGGCGGVIESLSSALIVDINSDREAHYINLIQIFLCTGAILCPVLIFAVINNGFSWRVIYIIYSLLFLIVLIAFCKIKIEEHSSYGKFHFTDFYYIVEDKKFIIVLICVFLYAGSESGVWGYISTFFISKIGQNLSLVLVSDFWIAMTLGRIMCGKLIDKIEIRKLICILSLSSALSVALSLVLYNVVWVFFSTFLCGFSFSSLYPLIMSMGTRQKNTAIAFSSIVAAGGLGNVIFSIIIAYVAQYSNVRFAQTVPALLLVFICILFMFFKKTGEKV